MISVQEILSAVDHTALAPATTEKDIRVLCDEAKQYRTASVCIPPSFVKLAAEYAKGAVAVCTVIGFPTGYQTTAAKVEETKQAVADGVDEIDMVINIGWVKDKKYDEVLAEIRAVKAACNGKLLKVIIETCLLTDEEKIKLCDIVSQSGAEFIKTSTGFSTGGATVEDIDLFAKHVYNGVKIKAAGGVRSLDDARTFLEHGAHRLGTSSLVRQIPRKNRRIFLFVMDSFGIGNAPDAAQFGDNGANTLKSVMTSPYFKADTLCKLGLGSIDGVEGLEKHPLIGKVARLQEQSQGKDTTTGHWELMGLVSQTPLPTYPNGFPKDLMDEFSRLTGKTILCNKPYSGTQVIADYGEEQRKTKGLIVYTSADSVFQIAAHTDVVPVEELYEYCRIARNLLTGEHAVGRVIARPFEGEYPFTRTADRRDFALTPPQDTLLDDIKNAGYACIGIGKIHDIFAGKGLTESVTAHGNEECMKATDAIFNRMFDGLCFVNFVDFDMVYGHRNDIDGYAKAVAAFDTWLFNFIRQCQPTDVVIITADHGCDPAFAGTDHTRECVPLLVFGEGITPENLGTQSFTAVSKLIKEIMEI